MMRQNAALRSVSHADPILCWSSPVTHAVPVRMVEGVIRRRILCRRIALPVAGRPGIVDFDYLCWLGLFVSLLYYCVRIGEHILVVPRTTPYMGLYPPGPYDRMDDGWMMNSVAWDANHIRTRVRLGRLHLMCRRQPTGFIHYGPARECSGSLGLPYHISYGTCRACVSVGCLFGNFRGQYPARSSEYYLHTGGVVSPGAGVASNMMTESTR